MSNPSNYLKIKGFVLYVRNFNFFYGKTHISLLFLFSKLHKTSHSMNTLTEHDESGKILPTDCKYEEITIQIKSSSYIPRNSIGQY